MAVTSVEITLHVCRRLMDLNVNVYLVTKETVYIVLILMSVTLVTRISVTLVPAVRITREDTRVRVQRDSGVRGKCALVSSPIM